MANSYFNAVYYLQNNPDVWAAGFTVDTAWNHYVQYGAFEANAAGGLVRAPNPWFDVKYYLTSNPDLIANGVTPATALDHFLTYGSQMGEDRAPNSAIAAAPITEAGLLAYALANEDLQKAFGIAADATELTVAQQNQLVNQFYSYGYDESRPDAPAAVNPNPTPVGSTFTLTANADIADTQGYSLAGGQFVTTGFKFTSANETVIASTATTAGPDSLIDASTTDNDVMNLSLTGNTTAFAAVQNIETVNVTATNTAAASFNIANFAGLKTIDVAGSPTAAISVINAATNNLTITGVSKIDASDVTSVAGRVTVNNSAGNKAIEIIGGSAADVLIGGTGNDIISGGAGADRLIGNAGADTISGGAGADVIDGGNGADNLDGGGGADIIIAGVGDDVVKGGGGNDTIVLGTAAGNVVGAGAFISGDVITGSTGTGTQAVVTVAGPPVLTDTLAYANGQLTYTDVASAGAATFTRDVVSADFTSLVAANAATSTALVTTAAGSNTVKFEATATDNGNDTIYQFNGGPLAAGGDIADVSAFLGGAVSYAEYASGSTQNVADQNVVVVTLGSNINNFTFAANANVLLVTDTDATTGGGNATVSYVTTDDNGAVVANTTVATLVGLTDLTDLDAVNFFGG